MQGSEVMMTWWRVLCNSQPCVLRTYYPSRQEYADVSFNEFGLASIEVYYDLQEEGTNVWEEEKSLRNKK